LAQQAIVFVFSTTTCCGKATSFSSESVGNFWQNKVLLRRLNPFLNIIHMYKPVAVLSKRAASSVIWQVPVHIINIPVFLLSAQTQQFPFLILRNERAVGN
jgi:hypothetical protein